MVRNSFAEGFAYRLDQPTLEIQLTDELVLLRRSLRLGSLFSSDGYKDPRIRDHLEEADQIEIS